MAIPSSTLPPTRESPAPATRSSRHADHRSQAIESLAMAGVNLFLVGIAVVSLVQLLPQAFLDKAKLNALQTELKQTQQRVSELQANYQRDSDPQQFNRIAQEENNLIAPNQRRVVWLQRNPGDSALSQPTPQTP